MNDITPRKRPLSPTELPVQQLPQVPVVPVQPVMQQMPAIDLAPAPQPPKRKKRLLLWILAVLAALLIGLALSAFTWYSLSLKPVNASDKNKVRVEIIAGSSPSDIAKLLQNKKLIHSQFAFDIYTRLSHTRSLLQAGTYNLSPSESTQAIVDHMVSGKVDDFTLTFLPGATVAEDRKVLISAGYSETDVDAALSKTYNHPLFTDKPASADLEGYIYGETYNFSSSASVEDVLTKTFDEYYAKIQQNNLVDAYKSHGLTLYQGITLASIIQREVPTPADQKQVAQVFYSRLSAGIALGSDVTYQYAAKKLGVDPSPNLDSPYNTRKYAGLPPGPIATPGLSALQAVASPASGDYLYFLSGDDDTTYFSRTNDEHEANIRDHCKVKCLIP
jgi:UPF0755 protein